MNSNYKDNGLKFLHIKCAILFWNKSYKSCIKTFLKLTLLVESLKHHHNIRFNYVPTCMEEGKKKKPQECHLAQFIISIQALDHTTPKTSFQKSLSNYSASSSVIAEKCKISSKGLLCQYYSFIFIGVFLAEFWLKVSCHLMFWGM